MNLTTIALALLAFKLLGNKSTTSKSDASKVDLGSFLSEDTQNLLACVNKLQDKSISQQDKTGAILSLLSNPAVMSILSNITNGAQSGEQSQSSAQQSTESESCQFGKEQSDSVVHQNDEGYTFDTPSVEAEQAFEPIKNIAGVEVSHKLYSLYDNWYAKKH